MYVDVFKTLAKRFEKFPRRSKTASRRPKTLTSCSLMSYSSIRLRACQPTDSQIAARCPPSLPRGRGSGWVNRSTPKFAANWQVEGVTHPECNFENGCGGLRWVTPSTP